MERGVVEYHGPFRPAGQGDGWGQQAVVGTDDHAGPPGDFDGDRLARRPGTRIDRRDDHAGRDVGDGPHEGEGPGADIEGRDAVGQVHDVGVRGEVAQDGSHDTGRLVVGAEIGQERDGVEAAAHRSEAR